MLNEKYIQKITEKAEVVGNVDNTLETTESEA